MSTKKTFFLLIACVALLIGSVGFLVIYGNGMLEQETKKLLDIKAESNALELQQQALIKAKRDAEQYSELENITQAIVPQDKDQARAVREIVNLAEQSGVKIKSITFPMSNLGSSSSSGTGTGSSSASPPSTPTISQAKPVSGIKGVYSLEMSIVPENSVSYYQFLEFLTRLEKNRRTSQVSRIKIDPITVNQRNSLVKFELTINIFLRP